MTRTIISPVCTVAGIARSEVRFVQQDPTTNELFVQCYTSILSPSYAICVAVFKPDGTLDRFAQVDMDGAGGTSGWSGDPCNFGIAPGGKYIIVAQPEVISGPGIAVLDRATLAHVQHATGSGQIHTHLCVSTDEVWAYTDHMIYNVLHNQAAALSASGPGAFDAANNLWVAGGNTLSKYQVSYGTGISTTLKGTFTPLGSTNIVAISYMAAINALALFGNDGSVWIFDIATETILRQAISSGMGGGVWATPFGDYRPFFYDTYVINSTDTTFHFACPYAGTIVDVPMSTWGVNAPSGVTAALWERTQQNIWSAHTTSTGDPNLGIEILPYAATLPPEPQPSPPPYNPGSPKRTRAWSYTMDGHTFYVLNLLDQGTFVYDTVTKQWSQFVTQGYDQWNMHNGVMWDKRPVGGDVATGQVYELDPEGVLDEGFRDISHIVTGGVQTRDRAYVSVSGLRVTGSPGALDEVNGSDLLMRYSDDGGNTWSDFFSITLTESDFSADLLYPSLGSFNAPGRIFELSDTGGLIRIDGCDAMLNGFNNDKQAQE